MEEQNAPNKVNISEVYPFITRANKDNDNTCVNQNLYTEVSHLTNTTWKRFQSSQTVPVKSNCSSLYNSKVLQPTFKDELQHSNLT